MKRFVWDTSAIVNIKEPDVNGYSPGCSLFKDLDNGLIPGPYQNIFPSLAVFEVTATVSRMHREGRNILREFYIMNENSVLYDLNQSLISKSNDLFAQQGFSELRGADLVFACIAYIEDAWLVTLDKHFKRKVGNRIRVLDLNESISSPNYLSELGA